MGGEPSLEISYNEKHQMTSFLASEPLDSRVAIRCKIILELSNGNKKKDIAKKCDVTPKTVWKTEHRYLVFGLDGILDDAPHMRSDRIINGDKANQVLRYPLLNEPKDSAQWTGTELARRLDLKVSTLYRFLNQWNIRWDNKILLQESCREDSPHPEEVVGLFISPSVLLVMFACQNRKNANSSIVTNCVMSPYDRNLSSFYRRTCNSIINLFEDARTLASSGFGRGLESTDVSRFLSLTDKRMNDCRRMLLATGLKSTEAWNRVEMYCANNPLIHFKGMDEDWREHLQDEIRRLKMMNKPNALRLENLEGRLEDWLTGVGRKTGTFFWINPFLSRTR